MFATHSLSQNQEAKHPDSILFLARTIPAEMGGGRALARCCEPDILPRLRTLALQGGPLQPNSPPESFALAIFRPGLAEAAWTVRGPGEDLLAWRDGLSALLCGDLGPPGPEAWFPSDGPLRTRQRGPSTAPKPFDLLARGPSVRPSSAHACALSTKQLWDLVACLDALAEAQRYMFAPLPVLPGTSYRPVEFGLRSFLASLNPLRR